MRPCPGLWIVVVRLMLLAFRFFFVNIISSQWVFLPFLVNRAKNAHIINVWKLYAYTTMLMMMTMIATTRVLKVILAIKWCNEIRLPSIGESILKNRYASSPLLRYICPMQFKVENLSLVHACISYIACLLLWRLHFKCSANWGMRQRRSCGCWRWSKKRFYCIPLFIGLYCI